MLHVLTLGPSIVLRWSLHLRYRGLRLLVWTSTLCAEYMMNTEALLRDLAALPSEAQEEAADFIAFLRARSRRSTKRGRGSIGPLHAERFVGMWRDRDDIGTGAAWVRRQRQREWNSTGA